MQAQFGLRLVQPAVGMPVVWHNRVGLPARPGPKPLHEAVTLDAILDGIA
jgi:hypothetical protein